MENTPKYALTLSRRPAAIPLPVLLIPPGNCLAGQRNREARLQQGHPMPLTDSVIKAAKAKEKPYKLSDAHGLHLVINPTGAKLWRLKYRVAGKEKLLSFGPYPMAGLQQARQLRDNARQQLAEGVDPGEHKKATKQAQKAEGLTFEVLANEWYAYNAPRWAESSRYKAKLYLENDIIPVIDSKPVKTITRPDLVEQARKVEARGTLNAASKIRQWLHQIFRYGLAKGAVEHNPATDLDVVAAPPKARRHPPRCRWASCRNCSRSWRLAA